MNLLTQKPDGCYAACISVVTGIALDEIPHPTPEQMTREDFSTYRNGLVLWLRERGWFLCYVPFPPVGIALVGGESPRGLGHECVALNGEVIFDPHPSRAGLVSVTDYEVLIQIVKRTQRCADKVTS